MTARVLVLSLYPCIVFAAMNSPAGPSANPDTPLDRAVKEFKTETEALGIRPGQINSQAGPPTRKLAWHGRVFENFRNDVLDAVPHEIKQRGEDKSLLQRNQFGFNVSGPLIIPKVLSSRSNTFFSLSYEGVRERIARTYLRTVPTLPERLGDFSNTVDQAGNTLPVYDPAATRPNPNYDASQAVSSTNLQYLRDPFPGNKIPSGRIDSVSREALSLYPAPNTNVGPFFQNNLFINSPATNLADGFLGNVDQTFGSKHRLSLDFNLSDGFLGSPRWFSTAANPGAPDRDFQTRKGSVQYVLTVSPKTVETATFKASMNTSRSTTGSDTPFPVYQIDPYVSFGTGFPESRIARNTFDLSDGISTRRGKHSLSLYAEFAQSQVNVFWPQYPSGYYNFSSGLTSLPGIINTGHAFASFLLGDPDYAERTFVTAPSYFRQTSALLSLRDKYEISKEFSITVGVNLNRHGARTEKYDRQSTVDPAAINPANGRPGALVFAGRNGISDGMRPAVYSVNPSASVVWNPGGSSNTVVRADYARSHQQMPIYSGQWATQGFNSREAIISQNNQLTPAVDLDAGLPPLPHALPDLRPDAANGAVADWMDLTGREAVYQSASASIERQLPFSLVVTAGAYYQGGRDLYVGNGSANPNAISPDALAYRDLLNDQSFSASLRPYSQYTSFDLFDLYPAGRYQRDAAYLHVEKRASNGLSVRASYEFGKQLDDYSGPYGIQDLFNRQNDWAQTPYSAPQTLQVSYVYELPIGANKPFLNYSDWRRPLVTGWSISGAAYMDDGSPLALHPAFNNTGGVISGLTVNSVPGVDANVPNPGPDLWFNPAAFDQPPDFTLGTASRTSPTLRNPGNNNFDLSVAKRLQIGLDRSMEFTATGFNFINHGDWNDPDTSIGPASAPNLDAGRIIGSHGGRVIQLGLTFNF
ncbi:MAG TPA: hypothetical protein VN737_20160 [Bryobacteraceae bacterium]|nr:hypothetical protein [Bryobacteraceae bacterium]